MVWLETLQKIVFSQVILAHKKEEASMIYRIVLVFLISVCFTGMMHIKACAADVQDVYLEYHRNYSPWCYSIKDYLSKRLYGYSPDCVSLVQHHNETTEINDIQITVSESLFDPYIGFMNVSFSSKTCIIRPTECLNAYAPIYQPPSEFSEPVCYVDYYIISDQTEVYCDTFAEGLSSDQHKLNVIQLYLPNMRRQYRFKGEFQLAVSVKCYDQNLLCYEEKRIVPLNMSVLSCLDSCLICDETTYENTILPPLKIYITPIQVWIPDLDTGTIVNHGDFNYAWGIYDEQGNAIRDAYHEGSYFSCIPDCIYLAIEKYDDQTNRFVDYASLVCLKRNADVYNVDSIMPISDMLSFFSQEPNRFAFEITDLLHD